MCVWLWTNVCVTLNKCVCVCVCVCVFPWRTEAKFVPQKMKKEFSITNFMTIQKENLSEDLDTCFKLLGRWFCCSVFYNFSQDLWTINAKSFWGWSPLLLLVTTSQNWKNHQTVLSSDLVWILNWTKTKRVVPILKLLVSFLVFLGELTSWNISYFNWFELAMRYRAIMPGSACFVLFWRQKEKQATKHGRGGANLWFLASVIALGERERERAHFCLH